MGGDDGDNNEGEVDGDSGGDVEDDNNNDVDDNNNNDGTTMMQWQRQQWDDNDVMVMGSQQPAKRLQALCHPSESTINLC